MVLNKNPDLTWLKNKLKMYRVDEIDFNEPHFTEMILIRDGNKEEVVACLLNPEKLVYYSVEKGKYGDIVYCLYFEMSNTRTIKLPIIFDANGKKGLYILTYIMRYRNWQSMARK